MSTRSTDRRTRIALVLSLVLALAACETLKKVAPDILSFARNMLTTAGENQSAGYVGNLENLMLALLDRRQPQQQPAPGQPPPPPGQPPHSSPISVDAAITGVVGGQEGLLQDGTVLQDAAGDRFRISYRPAQDCYVYVVLIDPTGFVQPLRPASGSGPETRVQGGRTYHAPSATDWVRRRDGRR